MLGRRSGPSPVDKLGPHDIGSAPSASDVQVILNLSGNGHRTSDSCLTLTPLFVGAPLEEALLGALLEGRSPVVEVHSISGNCGASSSGARRGAQRAL